MRNKLCITYATFLAYLMLNYAYSSERRGRGNYGYFEHICDSIQTVNINNNSSICPTHWQTVKTSSKNAQQFGGEKRYVREPDI